MLEIGGGRLAVRKSGAEAGVEFGGAGEGDDFADVRGVDAAAGEDFYLAVRRSNQTGKDRSAF